MSLVWLPPPLILSVGRGHSSYIVKMCFLGIKALHSHIPFMSHMIPCRPPLYIRPSSKTIISHADERLL